MNTKRKTGKARPSKGSETRRCRAYPFVFRLKLVPFHLQAGYSETRFNQQFDISTHSVERCNSAYCRAVTRGLDHRIKAGPRPRDAEKVRQQAVVIKKHHLADGPRRLSDLLRRFFLMSARPPSTAQRTPSERSQERPQTPVFRPLAPQPVMA